MAPALVQDALSFCKATRNVFTVEFDTHDDLTVSDCLLVVVVRFLFVAF